MFERKQNEDVVNVSVYVCGSETWIET
jgi:hypothetical protein